MTAVYLYGNRIYSAAADCAIIVWSASDHKIIGALIGHEASVWALAADELKVVSAGADLMVRVWDAVTYACVRVLRGHRKTVRSLHMTVCTLVTRQLLLQCASRRSHSKHISCA